MRPAQDKHIKDIIDLYLLNAKLNKGLIDVRLKAHWQNLVGEHVAKLTDKLQIKGTTLYISIGVAELANELAQGNHAIIIKHLNQAMGNELIQKLIFKTSAYKPKNV